MSVNVRCANCMYLSESWSCFLYPAAVTKYKNEWCSRFVPHAGACRDGQPKYLQVLVWPDDPSWEAK